MSHPHQHPADRKTFAARSAPQPPLPMAEQTMANLNHDKDRTRAMLLLPYTTPEWPQAWLEMCGLERTQPVFEMHGREVSELHREGNEGEKWQAGTAWGEAHADRIAVSQPEIPKSNEESQVRAKPQGKVAVVGHGKVERVGTKQESLSKKDSQVKAKMVEDDDFALWKGCCERCDDLWDS